MKNNVELEPSEFLGGWKAIADFLGKGVRTAQRYERELGLPVRRPAGKDRGSVVALKVEVTGWVKASPIREAFQLRPIERVEFQSEPHSIHRHVPELAMLRQQMSMLRAEVRDSVRRLHESLSLMQEVMQEGENQRHPPPTSSLFSEAERILLDRAAKDFVSAPADVRKTA